MKAGDNRPIGIFDSGIGGLTVASALSRQLPGESLVYFGDTAHLPYGEKSSAALKHYAEVIFDFLVQQDCKMVVIACNTASAVAGPHILSRAAGRIPLINVVDPTAEYVASKYGSGKVGVIATKATVRSRIYARRIQKLNPRLEVTMLATPLLVSMIEEGFFNNTISQTIIDAYLDKPNLRGIDAMILGCTHFPLIRQEVERYYKGKVAVIDSTEMVVNTVAHILSNQQLHSSAAHAQHHFFVSDLTQSFEKSTRLFFGSKLKLEQRDLWESNPE